VADTSDHTCRYNLQRFGTATAGWHRGVHPVVRIRNIVLAIVGSESCELEILKRTASIDIIRVTRRECDGGEQIALEKLRVSLRGVYVRGVNSTVTKHSDYFVWKDTSERVTWSCDDTIRQEASEMLYA